jgi:hypothetical protein
MKPAWIRWTTLAVLLAAVLSALPLEGAGSTRVLLPYVMNSRPPVSAGAFGYGANVASLGNLGLVRQAGFGYAKVYLSWRTSEPLPEQYQWVTSPGANDANNIANAARAAGLQVLIRVDAAPDWAAASGTSGVTRPPADPAVFARFMGALAGRLRGQVLGYEIWNEPNLSNEWGNRPPSPEAYAGLLRAVYPAVKAADPSALVVTAGLASTGGDGGATSLDDVQFLRRMYVAGARGAFDVLGSHPYGFSTPPEVRNPNNVTDFQRAADQRQVMVENGDAAKPVWATEMGWLLDPSLLGCPTCSSDPAWSGRTWQMVTPQAQADYLVRAYQYAYQNWPWMGVMFVFNLDFSAMPYYATSDPMRWYSVLNGDLTPRPAYSALQAMAKPLR